MAPARSASLPQRERYDVMRIVKISKAKAAAVAAGAGAKREGNKT